jgi:hypothetical protein
LSNGNRNNIQNDVRSGQVWSGLSRSSHSYTCCFPLIASSGHISQDSMRAFLSKARQACGRTSLRTQAYLDSARYRVASSRTTVCTSPDNDTACIKVNLIRARVQKESVVDNGVFYGIQCPKSRCLHTVLHCSMGLVHLFPRPTSTNGSHGQVGSSTCEQQISCHPNIRPQGDAFCIENYRSLYFYRLSYTLSHQPVIAAILHTAAPGTMSMVSPT